MSQIINIKNLKTSWTKYDIVQVMDVIYDKKTLNKYVNKEANINEPILKSFLGIESLDESIPDYWTDIQKFPQEKKLFALFAIIFTHHEVVEVFAEKYSSGDMTGVFLLEKGKLFTNIRSALIESGAAAPFLRREKKVPYDFSPIFQNLEVGKLFKKLLSDRLKKLTNKDLTEKEFYQVCYRYNFHKAISISENRFKLWLEGIKKQEVNYIDQVQIRNFFSIKEASLNHINNSKEVYFLGENGDGKSLILMAIYLAFNRHFITDNTEKEKTGKVIDIINHNKNMEIIGVDNEGKEYGETNVGYLNNFYAYGTHRGRYSTDKSEQYGFMSLFDSDQTLTNPISWLKDQRLKEIEQADKDLFNSSESFFSVQVLEKMFYELLEKNVEIKVQGNNVNFIEKGTNLSFDQLSEGYKSVIVFVSDLIFRLRANQRDINRIEDFRGVILVDEIDLHLHPKWQRIIVKKIRSIFPNIQFMFTTHSPNIIQGASNDAVIYRVYRNSNDGFTKISKPYYRKDLNHLMINTLLTSPLFGLENSRLDKENDFATTSESYKIYQIAKKLEEEIKNQKSMGKEFVSEEEIDSIILEVIKNEMK